MFWQDVQPSLAEDSYFLGLVILTGQNGGRKQVVDGQQRTLDHHDSPRRPFTARRWPMDVQH